MFGAIWISSKLEKCGNGALFQISIKAIKIGIMLITVTLMFVRLAIVFVKKIVLNVLSVFVDFSGMQIPCAVLNFHLWLFSLCHIFCLF